MTDLVRVEPAPLTADDRLARFAAFVRLRVADGDASPETVRCYMAQVGQFWAWCAEAGISPERATADDLAGYRRALVEAGYARATVATRLAVVRRFYDAARSWGLRADNPAQGLKAPRASVGTERIRYLPLDGLRKLLRLPDARTVEGRRDRLALLLMALQGLRVSEVAGLRLSDYHPDDPAHLTVLGKGRKVRRVYLVPATRKALDAWLRSRGAVARPGCDAVFVALDRAHGGQAITARGLRVVVDGYLGEAGLKGQGVSCHSLRHSYATWAYAQGADLLAVSRALGHAHLTTTQVYAKLTNEVESNPARKLEGVLT